MPKPSKDEEEFRCSAVISSDGVFIVDASTGKLSLNELAHPHIHKMTIMKNRLLIAPGDLELYSTENLALVLTAALPKSFRSTSTFLTAAWDGSCLSPDSFFRLFRISKVSDLSRMPSSLHMRVRGLAKLIQNGRSSPLCLES